MSTCCLDSQLTAELKEKDENDLMILDLLPTEHSAIRMITKYLVQTQNHFIQQTNPTADRYTVMTRLLNYNRSEISIETLFIHVLLYTKL